MAVIGQALTEPETGWKRIDDSDPAITYSPLASFPVSVDANSYNGSRHQTGSANKNILFTFYGTKIRIIGMAYSTFSSNIGIAINGEQYTFSQYTSGPQVKQCLNFEKTDMQLGYHHIVITTIDDKAVCLDAIDIDADGSILLYDPLAGKCKTTLAAANTIGSYIWCKYTATSNTAGVFSDIAIKTDAEVASQVIPPASSATPDGYFRFVLVGYDYLGRRKFIADRNIQHSISRDVLNAAGFASGSGVPTVIDDHDGCTLRLLTGGVSSADKYNEWDKIVVESTLGGLIPPGDNAVWNWNYSLSTITSTRTGTANCVCRGRTSNGVGYYTSAATSLTSGLGLRPMLLVDPAYNFYLFLKDDGSVYEYDGLVLNQVATDWDSLSSESKEALYLATSQKMPPASVLSALGKYKVMIYSAEASMATPSGLLSAAPKDRAVLPKGLIPLDGFEGIDSAAITSSIAGAGALAMAVTTNLNTYMVYSDGNWVEIDTKDIAAFKSSGMTPAALAAINRAGWDALTSGKQGIGFAYLPTIESASDTCNIDKIAMVVDMKGAWNRAVYGTDFTYGYPKNNLLRIYLLTNGDYKINYHESAVR